MLSRSLLRTGKSSQAFAKLAMGATSKTSPLLASLRVNKLGSSTSTATSTSITANELLRAFASVSSVAPTVVARAAPKENGAIPTARNNNSERVYTWIDAEAESLIAKAYARHNQGTTLISPRADITVAELEALGSPKHYPPQNMLDWVAYGTMRFLRIFTHLWFKTKFDHHALVLETVAAVPGIVASAFRHLRSLRRMERDHGWIPPLQEEAENERMHLLIWMKYTQPTIVERGLVILAQTVYLAFYTFLYAFSAQSAHRMVGYLEEEAHIAYTAFLAAVDSGALPNNPAPEIAIKYYNLKPDATIRDVVLHVRADECMHRDFNHMLADKVRNKDVTSPPFFMGVDTVKAVASEASKQ